MAVDKAMILVNNGQGLLYTIIIYIYIIIIRTRIHISACYFSTTKNVDFFTKTDDSNSNRTSQRIYQFQFLKIRFFHNNYEGMTKHFF
jgi:hypothetical protein